MEQIFQCEYRIHWRSQDR